MDEILNIILSTSQKYNVDPNLLYALLEHESMHFNPDVIAGRLASPAGALGIAQFMPATARERGVNPLNIHSAIPGAASYLSDLTRQFGGNTSLGLAAYNAGPGAVQRYGGIPPYAETQKYVNLIQARAAQYPTAQTQGANIPAPVSRPASYTPNLGQVAQNVKSYVVRPGDTLSGIAQRFLGNALSYNRLSGYRSGNPNLIYPGEVIRLA